MFKVNNRNTKTTSMILSIFYPFSSTSIADFEQINASRDGGK